MLEELTARIRRLLLRAGVWHGPRTVVTDYGELDINPTQRSVRLRGAAIELTRREFDLLVALVDANGQTLGYQDIARMVWGNTDAARQSLRRVICCLRRKLQSTTGAPNHLLSIRGRGYRLNIRQPRPEAGSDLQSHPD
jgi:DNA-binding response OmpR family regulator